MFTMIINTQTASTWHSNKAREIFGENLFENYIRVITLRCIIMSSLIRKVRGPNGKSNLWYGKWYTLWAHFENNLMAHIRWDTRYSRIKYLYVVQCTSGVHSTSLINGVTPYIVNGLFRSYDTANQTSMTYTW